MNAVMEPQGQCGSDGALLQLCVVETFRLGDLVYLTAFLYGLRRAVPDARIRVVTGPAGRAFAFPEELAVEVAAADWPWSNTGWWRHPLRSTRAVLDARRHLAQMTGSWVGLDPRGDIRHKCLLRVLKIRDVVRGDTRWQGLGRLLGRSSRHVLEERQAYLEAACRKLGIDEKVTLRWPWANDIRALRESSRRVILAPEAGALLREWPQERWILLSRELRRRGWKTELVVHSLQWKGVDISSEFDGVITGSVRDLSGRLRGAAVVIAVDSFVGHYAAAHGVPVLSLFGPQLAALWRPWGRGNEVIQRDGYFCRPCRQVRCVQPKNNCMKAIAVGEIVEVLQVMSEGAGTGFE